MGGGGGGREGKGDMVSREWTDDLTEVVGGSAGEIRRRPQFIHSGFDRKAQCEWCSEATPQTQAFISIY